MRIQSKLTFSKRKQIHFHQLLNKRFRHVTCIREPNLDVRISLIFNKNWQKLPIQTTYLNDGHNTSRLVTSLARRPVPLSRHAALL